MKINGNEINIEEIISEVKLTDELKKRKNGLILRDSHIEILNRYGINYEEFGSISSLILEIESVLETEVDADDLESVSEELAEINYYNYTNK